MPRSKRALTNFLAFLILASMGVLMVASVSNDAPTADEPPHILSGYVALKFGQDYIDPEHPLLAKGLAAAPLLFQNIQFNKNDPGYVAQKQALDTGLMFAASRRFLNYSGNKPDGIIFSARVPMILLTVFFGVIIFLFTRKVFGDLASLLATAFYATEPNILAHGRLVDTDMASAGFILLGVFALFLYFERQSTKRLIFLIFALSAALLAKYSTVYIFPLTLFLMGVFYLRKPSPRPWVHIFIVLIGVFFVISAFYGLIAFRENSCVGFFPCQYVKGLLLVQYELIHDNRFSYLLGESYYGSKLAYFPILLLAKTQLVLLASFAFSLILLMVKKLRLSFNTLVLLLVPPALFFALALTTKLNIGVRHILPIFPFMIILGAAAIAILLRGLVTQLGKKIGLSAAGLLLFLILGSRIWSVATTFPGYLSYYNVLFGGTENGWKVADDSNYDWGQDVKRLADYVEKHKINSIAFDNYTGDYAARYYNIPVKRISPKDTGYKGYIALSTSVITFHENQKDNYSWVVDKYKPLARAGYSIFIYKIQ